MVDPVVDIVRVGERMTHPADESASLMLVIGMVVRIAVAMITVPVVVLAHSNVNAPPSTQSIESLETAAVAAQC